MSTANEIEENTGSTIAIVDADVSLRKQIVELFTTNTCVVEEFESAQDLLLGSNLDDLNCLILSIESTHQATRNLINTIKQRNHCLSIIAIGNQGDVPQAVTSIRAGADEYLYRPINNGKIRTLVHQLLSD